MVTLPIGYKIRRMEPHIALHPAIKIDILAYQNSMGMPFDMFRVGVFDQLPGSATPERALGCLHSKSKMGLGDTLDIGWLFQVLSSTADQTPTALQIGRFGGATHQKQSDQESGKDLEFQHGRPFSGDVTLSPHCQT
jgi:hypothetical protein